MTRIRVPLGKFIKEYSERNKGNEDIPVYSVTNSQGFCTEYFGKEVASQDKTTYKIVPQGYFAYNPSRINVGSVDWQRYEKRVIVSPLYNVFSVSEGIDRQYLYYFLRSDLGRQMIKAKASGSVRDNLKLDMLKEMTIPDISVEQQKFCSSVLDKLHKLIQMRQQELQKLDEFIKARFVEMFGDVIHNSKKWQVCLFAEITSSRLGKMLDAKQQTGRNSYPYLANFNVQWFRFNLENLNKMDFDEKDRAEFELLLPYLILFQHSFFHYIDQSIQSHCHNTEQNNRHEKPIHLKYLTGIDDQISKSAFGSEKFSDNDSHKTKSDIDFHIAYDCRNRGRQYNFCKRMPAVSVQCIYQFDLFLIDIDKGGIQIQDTSEDGDGHSGNNNCF